MSVLPQIYSIPVGWSELDALTASFFRQSAGKWLSQRRYYTLKNAETQEVVSQLTIRFLDQGCQELEDLARLHGLAQIDGITSGVATAWESNYIGPSPRQLTGESTFGVAGNLLYRDRGFSTPKPVIAEYAMRDANTMTLRTEYNNNVFEEEVKLIGEQYRTRQTVISRAGEEQMIGQYLEIRQ
jgi:hypothetical protein